MNTAWSLVKINSKKSGSQNLYCGSGLLGLPIPLKNFVQLPSIDNVQFMYMLSSVVLVLPKKSVYPFFCSVVINTLLKTCVGGHLWFLIHVKNVCSVVINTLLKTCVGGHLWFLIHVKNVSFKRHHAMTTHVQFWFNHACCF